MKILHIPATLELDLNEIKNIKLQGKIGLVTTIQYSHHLKNINKIIKNSIIVGYILGCDISNAKKIANKIDSFLFIGTGKFHPIKLASELNKPVYIFNPETNNLYQVSQQEINEVKSRKKGSYIKYLNAEKIGLLISLKPGQYNLNKALQFKKKSKKQSYLFLFNTLNTLELENFPQIQSWVNTACPRIEYKNIINIEDLQ
ncbi:MAG: diphthamide synthesis protein [Candidatus Woesearchaeota archaeon]|nr:diphthamide synthesis protein [Candidatus Woesearchaeota archaeon]